MNLYELTTNLVHIENMMSEEGTSEELEERRKEIEQILTYKLNGIRKYIANNEANIEAIKNETKRLGDIKKQLESNNERIEKFIIEYMEKNGEKKLKTDLGTFTLRNTKSVEVIDATQIPDSYTRRKITIEPDKVKIKTDIENGCIVDGCILKEYNTLTIK